MSPQDPVVTATELDETAQAEPVVLDTNGIPAREPATETYHAGCQASQSSSKSHSIASPLPLFDAQIAIQHHLARLQGLTTNKRQILESALHVASHLSEYFGGSASTLGENESPLAKGENPSHELLTWMLKGWFLRPLKIFKI